MWPRRDEEVTCIACGATVERAAAREYDKHGDRFDRREKRFEFLCKPCHRVECHQPRGGLEQTLTEAGAGERDRTTFLARYTALAAGDPGDHRQRESK